MWTSITGKPSTNKLNKDSHTVFKAEINNLIQAFQSEAPRLIDQIELNDQLNQRMEDIYPDIEKTDDMSSTAVNKASTKKSK